MGAQANTTKVKTVNPSTLTPSIRSGRPRFQVHLYSLTCNTRPTELNDPWTNDYDWALINLLTIRGIQEP